MTDNPKKQSSPDLGEGGAVSPAPPVADGRPPVTPTPDQESAARAYGSFADGHGAGAAAPTDADEPAPDAPEPVSEMTREELEQALAETQVALSLAEAQRDEHLADLQRKAAELSNVLKREQRNANVGRIEGRIDVLRGLVEVLDDFDRTMEAAAGSPDAALRSGVALVHDKLAASLAVHGLERVGQVGEAFDPNLHEAVHQVEAEDGPLETPVIEQVFRPGYLVGERVVRAAMVVVRL